MNSLLNVWLPKEAYEPLKNKFSNPAIFALIKDEKPTLEMYVAGEKPEMEFDQFMFLQLPNIAIPEKKEHKILDMEKEDGGEKSQDPGSEDPK